MSRNALCACGSGLKYKRCCLGSGASAPGTLRGPASAGSRIVDRNGRAFQVTAGIGEEDLEGAFEYFERRERGEGPAQQMMAFVQPLVEAVGNTPEKIEKALSLGMLFWNLAVLGDEELQEKSLATLIDSSGMTDEEGRSFRATALAMLERHRSMFPHLHRSARTR